MVSVPSERIPPAPPMPPRPRLGGHESVLSAIQRSGRTIEIETIRGETDSGVLVAFDRYTLTILSSIDQRRRIYFKSALVYFS